MKNNDEVSFFDEYAKNWDFMREEHPAKLCHLIELSGICQGMNVLDVGSGTGVLLPYLHCAIGNTGTISAIDFSASMLKKAKEKFGDVPGISFYVADIMRCSLLKNTYDSVICLNFFPHLGPKKEEYLEKMYSVLRWGGSIVVMHDISRDKVNQIHGKCQAVKDHVLPAAFIVEGMLKKAGYHHVIGVDNEEMYFVKGIK